MDAERADDRILQLRTCIIRLVEQGHDAPLIRNLAIEFGRIACMPALTVAEVEHVLDDQLLRIQRIDPVPDPPELDEDARSLAALAQRADLEPDHEPPPKPAQSVPSRVIDFRAMAAEPVPEFQWYVPHWLSPHPTLLSGRGGIGKSLTALQMAVALATGKQFLHKASAPLRVVLWSCEEDRSELHRRLDRICAHFEITINSLADNLLLDCRHGLDNTLLFPSYGQPQFTSLAEYLREQVNDWRADVWIGDNLAHLFACSENERHPVTMFTSYLSGLRPSWATVLIGHTAKLAGSEYSGSTAWENACRMRWYLSDKLPDQKAEDDTEDDPGQFRYLCKRKANYSAQDYVRFTLSNGLLVPDLPSEDEKQANGDSGLVASLRAKRARNVILECLAKFNAMDLLCSESPSARDLYLPRRILEHELAQGCTKAELAKALRQLRRDGAVVMGVCGKDASYRPRMGLRVASAEP